MARTPKKLHQTMADAELRVAYTAPVTRTQVTEVWLTNTGKYDTRSVSIYAHGIAPVNAMLLNLEIPPGSTKVISEMKVVLAQGETLAYVQDAGADIAITAYGIEEAL